jgi:hypothetical protein
MVNVKFARQLCQSLQPEMRLDYSGTIAAKKFRPSLSRPWHKV